MFPKIEEVFKEEEEGKIKNKITFLNYDNIMKKLNRVQIPPKLDFFVGGEENKDLQSKIIQLGIDENCLEIVWKLEICFLIIKILVKVSIVFFSHNYIILKNLY